MRAGWRRPGRRPGSAPRRRGPAAPARWSRRRCRGRPGRRCSRSAMAASVCASTAEVGSDGEQHLRVGVHGPGQPDPLPLPAGQVAAAPLDRAGPGRSATSCGDGRVDRPAGPASSSGSSRPATTSRSGPANRSASWSATRIRARTSAGAMPSSRRPPQVASVGPYRPSRSITAAASAGAGAGQRGQPARLGDHAGLRVVQRGRAVAGAARAGRVVRRQAQEVDHPPGGDQAAGDVEAAEDQARSPGRPAWRCSRTPRPARPR